MIKVNIKTQECSRYPLPKQLNGLTENTLQNLQTELDPVPEELVNIEFWPESVLEAPFDTDTQQLGDEILTPDFADKIVNVSREVLDLTAEELAIKQEILRNRQIEEIKHQATIDANAPVTINGVTYNGGDGSAAAINGAVGIAQSKGLDVVTVWDINNVNAEYSLAEGLSIALAIGDAYSQVMYQRNIDIAAV